MGARKNIDWDAQPLGKLSDGEIARRIGCSAPAVALARRQRGIMSPCRVSTRIADLSFVAPLLGKMTDREVAAAAGITYTQARRARVEAGTPTTRIDWSKQPIGTMPDAELARLNGVDLKVVAFARWKRGIPAWSGSEQRKCPCGETFAAFHKRQRYCSDKCQRYHWQLRKEKGLSAEMADLAIALWAFKKTAKEKHRGVAKLSRSA